jgi:SAM-dependent methyltransferase
MMLKIKKILSRIFLIIGFNPRNILLLKYYSKYLNECKKFIKMGGVITTKYPILTDYYAQAGSASGHYFHQDLLVASFINQTNPTRHLDIGSRIDGFVAHVASFRKIDVMDVRFLKDIQHKNISFIQADLMNMNNSLDCITDSISCLHAIEHFGLGRYGDKIDPLGHIKGFNNILRMLKPGGTLFISFPISNKNEVHFNAHRVFHPRDIFNWPEAPNSIKLKRFDYVDDLGDLHQDINPKIENINVSFGCGIYTFVKNG